jgi:hypothetical protein
MTTDMDDYSSSPYLNGIHNALRGAHEHEWEEQETHERIQDSLSGGAVYVPRDSAIPSFLDQAWDHLEEARNGNNFPEGSTERNKFEVKKAQQVSHYFALHAAEYAHAAEWTKYQYGKDHPISVHMEKKSVEKKGWLKAIDAAATPVDSGFLDIMQKSNLNPRQFGFEE